jgi:hypothetical protein
MYVYVSIGTQVRIHRYLISVNNTRDNEEADTTIVVHIVDSLQAGSQIRTANTDIVTIPN